MPHATILCHVESKLRILECRWKMCVSVFAVCCHIEPWLRKGKALVVENCDGIGRWEWHDASNPPPSGASKSAFEMVAGSVAPTVPQNQRANQTFLCRRMQRRKKMETSFGAVKLLAKMAATTVRNFWPDFVASGHGERAKDIRS